MKRLAILLPLFLAVITLNSQETGGIVFNYKALERKLQRSDADIVNPKKNMDPRTWLIRGLVMIEIHEVHTQYLRRGMNNNQVKLIFNEPKELKDLGNGKTEYVYERITLEFDNNVLNKWTETVKIHEDPLKEAKIALEKTLELDTEGRNSTKVKENLVKLKPLLEDEAILSFIKDDLKNSFTKFTYIIDINQLPIMEGVIDTIIYYSAGRVARENNDCVNALEMFNKAIEYEFNDPNIYVVAFDCYKTTGDTATGFALLQKGFMRFPDFQLIQVDIINYYLSRNESEKALDYLKMAQESDPENISFVFVEGTVYDKMGNHDAAIGKYKQCLTMNPNYYEANYNLAIVYYNRAVQMSDKCQDIMDIKKYNECMEGFKNGILEAIPFMEAARDVASALKEKCDAMETLRILYYRSQQEDKMNEMIEQRKSDGCN